MMVMTMRIKTLVAAAAASVTLCVTALPAAADIPNAYGMWDSGSSTGSKPIGSGFSFQKSKKTKLQDLGSATPSKPQKSKGTLQGGSKPSISADAPVTVAYKGGYKKGSVIVDQSQKKLYYVLGDGKAYAYPVAVGKKGFSWTGTQKVSRIQSWPDWTPPAEMRQRKPELPAHMNGGINNPLGAKAIYLGSTLYRIHGTNAPGSIGTAASSGCIRMHNGHVVHLAKLVDKGTTVHVVR